MSLFEWAKKESPDETSDAFIHSFVKGVMARIRDHIKENAPEAHKQMDTDTEITGRNLKNGERVWYVRKRKKGKA